MAPKKRNNPSFDGVDSIISTTGEETPVEVVESLSQVEKDLAVLVEAQKIRTDGRRYLAVKQIAAGRNIGG